MGFFINVKCWIIRCPCLWFFTCIDVVSSVALTGYNHIILIPKHTIYEAFVTIV